MSEWFSDLGYKLGESLHDPKSPIDLLCAWIACVLLTVAIIPAAIMWFPIWLVCKLREDY